MIIQKTLKGISRISETEANIILQTGILCNWWRSLGFISVDDIPKALTKNNLNWHQNSYHKPYPANGNKPFKEITPFISTTAGSISRQTKKGQSNNFPYPALQTAINFATEFGKSDGIVFYCYLFTLGKESIEHQNFSEEIRELNIHKSFSPYYTQGEVTAKILIPPTQIEKYEIYNLHQVRLDFSSGRIPKPSKTVLNPLFQSPENICNIRDFLK